MTVSLEALRLDGRGGLWKHLASLPDPRISQCRRHSLISIFKIVVASILSGAEHAKGVGQQILRNWILSLGLFPAALTLDGKKLRGSTSPNSRSAISPTRSPPFGSFSPPRHHRHRRRHAHPARACPFCSRGQEGRLRHDRQGQRAGAPGGSRRPRQRGFFPLRTKRPEPSSRSTAVSRSGRSRSSIPGFPTMFGRISPSPISARPSASSAPLPNDHRRVAYGIASHSPEKASPRDLLDFVRNHWSIEKRLHWKEDVVLREDRSTVRAGNGAKNMAEFRNLAVSLSNIKKTTGYFAELLRSFAWEWKKVFCFICL